jgi:hypothetical protein
MAANTWHHLACSQTMSRFHIPIKITAFYTQQSQLTPLLDFTDTFIPSPPPQHTLLMIAVTYTIGPPVSHCHLVSIIWNLIEAKIKRKR